jgi:exo-beta-1,3-glucanase (GH17 family)
LTIVGLQPRTEVADLGTAIRHESHTTTSPRSSIATSSTLPTSSVSPEGVSVPSFDSSRPFVIAYSPLTASRGCKSVSAIAADLQKISAAGFQAIRLYGTDCGQVSSVLSAIQSTGSNLKLFLGIFDLSAAATEADAIISAFGADWSRVITISVGNEVVNSGVATPDIVVRTTSAVRAQLRACILS